MLQILKRKHLPLKTVYYLSFVFFIVIPILLVLLGALLLLNRQFKRQAMENIERAQEAVMADLISDIDIMSMRLSYMVYTNNNEILSLAAGTDVADRNERYAAEQGLSQRVSFALEPVRDIISVGFYMKDGRDTYIKSEIKRSTQQIKGTAWYRSALSKPNTVMIGYYDTASTNDLFTGGRKDMLVLVFALAPDVSTDRSQKVEMVLFYQSTGAADRIKAYNAGYLKGENKLGITQVTDGSGNIVFTTQETEEAHNGDITCVRTPIELNNAVWYLESYIPASQLTADFWNTGLPVLGAAVLVLLFAGYYSRYFLQNIVTPIEQISGGLKQVEEGNMDVHITPSGQYEVRTMIHQFNAMARQLKALIEEYEQRAVGMVKSPEGYFRAMLKGKLTPEEVNRETKEFFQERYAILGIRIDDRGAKETENTELAAKLEACFERNPLYASRCLAYAQNAEFYLVYYRIMEEDYLPKMQRMATELQRNAAQETGAMLSVCIGAQAEGYSEFEDRIEEVRRKMCFRHLAGENAVINLEQKEVFSDWLLERAPVYGKLADALYIADEKNMVQEREKLFALFHSPRAGDGVCGQAEENHRAMETMRREAYAVILAIGCRFSRDHSDFADIFGQRYNYIDKIGRIEDARSLKLWLTNYFAWIMDYSASRLNVAETDRIARAKRYIADHCEDAGLSLACVAEYVGLNEKYFTNCFTKETGETFSAYLTALRMQKARELLKTTSFKVYEIAEMSGYRNAEHFNRMFKKENGISPVQYRKTT